MEVTGIRTMNRQSSLQNIPSKTPPPRQKAGFLSGSAPPIYERGARTRARNGACPKNRRDAREMPD